jgi:hypothetical protein
MLCLHAVLLHFGIARASTRAPRSRALGAEPGMVTAGVAFFGLGMATLTDDHAFRALAAPGFAMAGLIFLTQAIRGPRSGWLSRHAPRSGVRGFFTYAGCWMFGLVWPLGIAWAFGLVRISN